MPWKPLPQPSRNEQADFEAKFKKKARFLVDESVDPAITGFLRERGWNVRDVYDMGISGQDDESVLAAAHRDHRVLLTHDHDFLDDHRFPLHSNAGVVVLPGDASYFGALSAAVHNMLLLVGTYRNFQRGTKVEFFADGSLNVKRRNAGREERARYRFTGRGPAEIWDDEY